MGFDSRPRVGLVALPSAEVSARLRSTLDCLHAPLHYIGPFVKVVCIRLRPCSFCIVHWLTQFTSPLPQIFLRSRNICCSQVHPTIPSSSSPASSTPRKTWTTTRFSTSISAPQNVRKNATRSLLTLVFELATVRGVSVTAASLWNVY